MGALHSLWERRRESVAFVVVYVAEIHPEDGWVVNDNRKEGIEVGQPTSFEERESLATTCAINLEIRMPVVIDGMDNRVASAYGALPDRLYLIGKGDRIAYQGERGPEGFVPAELANAIEAELA